MNIVKVADINNPVNHGVIIKSLAGTFTEAFDKPPVKVMMNKGAERKHIESLLAVIILKHARMLNVSGNLQEGQALEIAKMLIDEYPYSSLDDFNLMLDRGIKSRYGTVYRFDISVIFEWMNKYVDEYYEEKERQIRDKKVEAVSEIKPLNEEQKKKVHILLQQYLEEIRNIEVKSIPPLTDEQIKAEGREMPLKKKYIPDPEYVALHNLRMKWMRHCFDPKTGKPNDNFVSFEEFQKLKL